MTPEFLTRFSLALSKTINNLGLKDPVLIARDTRQSGIEIEAIISETQLIVELVYQLQRFYQLLDYPN